MDMKNNCRLFKKLNGYQKADRGRFMLLALGELSHEEFLLYEIFEAITDWDNRHVDTYGTFEATNKDLAMVLGWRADSTVSRHKKSLINKGYVERIGDRFKTKDFEKWELRKRPANMKNKSADMQVTNANNEDILADLQDIPF